MMNIDEEKSPLAQEYIELLIYLPANSETLIETAILDMFFFF